MPACCPAISLAGLSDGFWPRIHVPSVPAAQIWRYRGASVPGCAALAPTRQGPRPALRVALRRRRGLGQASAGHARSVWTRWCRPARRRRPERRLRGCSSGCARARREAEWARSLSDTIYGQVQRALRRRGALADPWCGEQRGSDTSNLMYRAVSIHQARDVSDTEGLSPCA